MLRQLANEGMLSKKIAKINEHGVPMRALLLSMIGAVLALIFEYFYAADTVYTCFGIYCWFCCGCCLAINSSCAD